MKNLSYLKNVVTLKLDENKCTGCGMCLEVCPHQVFKMNGQNSHDPESRCLHGVRRLPEKLPGRGDLRGIRGGLRRCGNKFPAGEK